ncbi:MAG: hypothetical protein IJ701_05875 [Bacteroidales bacterium]|nr:hypothetical protein [Bacteroidales bacterium]
MSSTFLQGLSHTVEELTGKLFGENAQYHFVYFIRTRKFLNLKNPKNWNEKMIWLAKYWRNPLIVKCADKYAVRDYLTSKGCQDILNEEYAVYQDAKDIDFAALPRKFVLKCNHGSKMNIICEDKDSLDTEAARAKLDKWMSTKYGRGAEWQYKNIERKILAEKYLESSDGTMIEYQIFCFNGKPMFFLVRNDLRKSAVDKSSLQYAVSYSIDWKRLYMRKGEEKFDFELPKPHNYDKMIEYARRLSADFPQVRVDYYEIDKKLVFGELTFSSNGNVQTNYKEEYIKSLGAQLQLPPKYIEGQTR